MLLNKESFFKNNFFRKYFNALEDQVMLIKGEELTEKERENLLLEVLTTYNENNTEHPLVLITNNQDANGEYFIQEKKLSSIFSALHREDPRKRITMTGNGSMFNPNQQSQTEGLIKQLTDGRDAEKDIMFQYPKGSSEYELHDTIQRVLKVLANSWYGANSQSSFVFFTPWSGSAVTLTGQRLVMNAAMTVEAFLADNVPFRNEQVVFNFITNVFNEETKLDIEEIVDKEFLAIEVEEIHSHLMNKCTFEITDTFSSLIMTLLNNLDEEVLLRLRYKNQLFKLLDHSSFTRSLIEQSFDPDFIDPMAPTEKNKDSLHKFFVVCKELVAYIYIEHNISEIFHSLYRKKVLVVDTDSTFVDVDPLLRYSVEAFKLDPVEASTSSGRIRICNVFTNMISRFIAEVMNKLTFNMGVLPERQHLIDMKSEFLIQRILLTDSKKSYAGSVILQEGNKMEKPDFDMKGLPIKKVNTPRPTREYFQKLLKEDILEVQGRINIFDVLEKYTSYAEFIRSSLQNKELSFWKPAKFNSIAHYKEPYSQQNFTATLIWNAATEDQDKRINNFESIYVGKIKDKYSKIWDISDEELIKLDPSLPAVVERINLLFTSDKGLDGKDLSSIALPRTIDDVPSWLVSILDVENMIVDNLQAPNSILQALNIYTIPIGQGKNYLSNIITL